MTTHATITAKLSAAFAPTHLEAINESHKHNVPAGSESHFNVIIVSEAFAGQSRIARHRAVNRCLADELAGSVHALSVKAYTQDEWSKVEASALATPDCLGGSK